MTIGRLHTRTHLMVTIWTLIWMVLAAPCAVAGDMGMAGAETDGPEATQPNSGHLSPGSDDHQGAHLLCLQDCNQPALEQASQDESPAPLAGLAEDRTGHAMPSLSGTPSSVTHRGGPPAFRAATYLLNRTFLI